MAPEKAMGLAIMPAPVDLDDAGSLKQTAVTKTGVPHENPGL